MSDSIPTAKISHRRLKNLAMIASSFVLLAGCASAVKMTGVQLEPNNDIGAQAIRIQDEVTIVSSAGYASRVLAGSTWVHVGSTSYGDVYKRTDGVFTIKGAHQHEAYLVISDGTLNGFYLPVKEAYSAARKKMELKLINN